MSNPIMSMLRTPSKSTGKSNLPDASKMSFAQFVKEMQGRDAKSIVDELRNSGRMNEKQYNMLVQSAQSLLPNLK